jgi:S1-C subfamily serine protease
MKCLLPILLLVFSVGVGDVYAGDRGSSPEVAILAMVADQVSRECKPREFKQLAEQLLFSTDGTIIGQLGDDAIAGLALTFLVLYSPFNTTKEGGNCALLTDAFRSSVWSSISYRYENKKGKAKLDARARKGGHASYLALRDSIDKYDGINPNQRASAANDIIDRIERTRTIRAQQRSGSSAKKKSGSTGTGFFINQQGHIITNSHVVKDCKQISTLYRGSKVSTSLITNDPRNDLALLKASTRPSAIAYFRSV